VARARVTVEGRVTGEIGAGLLLYLGCEAGDGEAQARRLAGRAARLRVFADAGGRTNLDLAQAGGAVLLVPQFTLAADLRKGHLPSFGKALEPAAALRLVAVFAQELRAAGHRVEEGVFGAEMEVESVNLGPATYVLEESPAGGPAAA
jgi:D-tyrosyl-tRNA(Tyr) deacylase